MVKDLQREDERMRGEEGGGEGRRGGRGREEDKEGMVVAYKEGKGWTVRVDKKLQVG